MLYVLLYVTLCPFSFAIISMGKRWLVALLILVFLASCDCCVALPRGFMGLSAVYTYKSYDISYFHCTNH